MGDLTLLDNPYSADSAQSAVPERCRPQSRAVTRLLALGAMTAGLGAVGAGVASADDSRPPDGVDDQLSSVPARFPDRADATDLAPEVEYRLAASGLEMETLPVDLPPTAVSAPELPPPAPLIREHAVESGEHTSWGPAELIEPIAGLDPLPTSDISRPEGGAFRSIASGQPATADSVDQPLQSPTAPATPPAAVPSVPPGPLAQAVAPPASPAPQTPKKLSPQEWLDLGLVFPGVWGVTEYHENPRHPDLAVQTRDLRIKGPKSRDDLTQSVSHTPANRGDRIVDMPARPGQLPVFTTQRGDRVTTFRASEFQMSPPTYRGTFVRQSLPEAYDRLPTETGTFEMKRHGSK